MATTPPPVKPVQVTRVLGCPPGEVWSAISTPGHLENVHPFCEVNPVIVWPGPTAHDEVHYRSGWVYHRHFTQWRDGEGYDLDIGATGEPTSHVRWRIAASDDNTTCSLTITVWPRQLSGIPGLEAAVQWLVVRPRLRRYLESVVQGVEWFVHSGQPVSEDQFGSHPWFSRRNRRSSRNA